jgi:hypothetical protein
MTWYAFRGYNTIDLAGAQEKVATAWGFHGYATRAQAEAHPNSVNLLQKAIVDTLEADYAAAVKGGAQPGGPNASNPLASGLQAANLGGINAIGDFFNRLTQPNTWIRVGEVIGGLLLVYIGLKATTSGTEVATAAKTGAKPVKAIAKATPAGRSLAVEKRARTIARRRRIESAAGRRATIIKQKRSGSASNSSSSKKAS